MWVIFGQLQSSFVSSDCIQYFSGCNKEEVKFVECNTIIVAVCLSFQIVIDCTTTIYRNEGTIDNIQRHACNEKQ